MFTVIQRVAFFSSVLYVFFCVIAFKYGFIEYRAGAVLLGVMVFLIMLVVSKLKDGLSFFCIIGLLVCFFTFSFFNYKWSQYRSVFTVFVFVASFGVAWYSLEFKKTKYFFEYPFIVFLFYTVYLLVFEKYGPADFNTVLFESSRNVYSGILLALASGYVFSKDYRGEKISIILLFLVCLVSIPLYSRNGIFVSVVLLFCALWQRSIAIMLLLFFAGLVSIAIGWEYFYELIVANTNLSAGLESDRYLIIKDYLDHLDLFGFFAGVDLSSVPMVEVFGGNPHSAFLRLHSFFGVSLFLLFAVSGVSMLMLLYQRKFFLAIILVLYFFRAAFDIFYLFNLFDYLVFPLVFYWYFRRYGRQSYLDVSGR